MEIIYHSASPGITPAARDGPPARDRRSTSRRVRAALTPAPRRR